MGNDRPLVNYYRVLGIENDAPGEVVERAYWQLVNNRLADGSFDKRSAATLEDANEAYRVLVSPQLRGAYDEMLANGEIVADLEEEGAGLEPPLKVLSKLHPGGRTTKTNGTGARRQVRNHSLLRLLTPSYLKLTLLLFGALCVTYVVGSSNALLSPTNEALTSAGAVMAVLLLLALAREIETQTPPEFVRAQRKAGRDLVRAFERSDMVARPGRPFHRHQLRRPPAPGIQQRGTAGYEHR